MPHKKLFQPLRHSHFLGCVFTKYIIKKTTELLKLAKQKVFVVGQ
jgi:hypothetical protein